MTFREVNVFLAGPLVAMKGDLAVRGYRRPTKDANKIKERKAFEIKLTAVTQGYKAGKNLDSYAVDRTLGSGSFGRVLLVQDKDTKQFCAVKIISKDRVIQVFVLSYILTLYFVVFIFYFIKNPSP